jgi:type I restriction enzyme M protein
VDLRQVGIPFEKKYTQFSDEEIKKITDCYHGRQTKDGVYQDIPEFCYSASFDEIAKKDFSLVPSKYIQFVNRDENIDFHEKMTTLQKEFSELLHEEAKSRDDLLLVFKNLGYEIKL